MIRPVSSTAPTRERRGGKLLLTISRRLHRFAERLNACGECAVLVLFGALFLLIVLGAFK